MNISVKDTGNVALYPELRRIGFDGVDISFPSCEKLDVILSDGFEETMLARYQALCEAGLTVCQTHLTYYPGHYPPLGDGSFDAYEAAMLPIYQKELSAAAKMSCPIAVIHLFGGESREHSHQCNLRLIQKLLPTLEQYDITLCIENIYGSRYADVYLSSAEDVLFYIDSLKSDRVGICLDTGHAIAMKQNPVEMAQRIGPSLKALHLHSSIAGRDLHLPPAMFSNVDWQALCRTLSEIGYGGSFNMETTPPCQLKGAATLAYYELLYAIAESFISDNTTP